MKGLCTEIEIQEPPEKVWQILTDLDKWPEWNPFIHHAITKVQVGEAVDITFRSAAKEMTLHCTVITAEPNRELRWKYHVILPVLFWGEHSFVIEPMGSNRLRFIDREMVNGLRVPLQAKDIDTDSRRGFEEMDEALNTRAEQVWPPGMQNYWSLALGGRGPTLLSTDAQSACFDGPFVVAAAHDLIYVDSL